MTKARLIELMNGPLLAMRRDKARADDWRVCRINVFLLLVTPQPYPVPSVLFPTKRTRSL